MNTRSNPFDNIIEINNQQVFRGIDENTFNDYNQMGKIDEAFADNVTYLNPMDFSNKYNVIDNNLAQNINKESEYVYNAYIHSINRNITYYPNPLSFVVGSSTGVDPTFGDINLLNVKFIRFDCLYLPHSLNVTSTTTFSTVSTDLPLNLPFIVLKIKELSTNSNILSTGSELNTDSFMLKWEATLGNLYDRWVPSCNLQPFIYKTNNLLKLSQLTIKLYDPWGNQLLMSGLNQADTDVNNYTCPSNNYIQMMLSMNIGVINIDLQTKPNFRY